MWDADWRNLFEQTLLEKNTEQLQFLAHETEGAMFLRLQEIEAWENRESELREIKSAWRELRSIQVERLHFPDLS
jgi:uncharacterized protein YjaZ